MKDPWVGMPGRSFEQIGTYLRTIGDTLGLTDWSFHLASEPCDDENASATVAVTDGRRHAVFRVEKDFVTIPRREQEVALIHEVLHVHLHPMSATLDATLETLVGKPAATVVTAYQLEAEEQAVDALAHALRPLLPRLPRIMAKR